MKYKERDELVSSLRELADFIEGDGIALPRLNVYVSGYATKHVYSNGEWTIDAPKTKAIMRRVAVAMSPCEKDYAGPSFGLKRKFGVVRVEVTAQREAVCVANVVGKKVVPKYRKYGTEEVDDIEWICGDPLLA